MPFLFEHALNPSSEFSGTQYVLAHNRPCQYKEMLDRTLQENLYRAWYEDHTFIQALASTFEIILGRHYDLTLRGANDCRGGAKGILDYLIFPLIARKLINDIYLHQRHFYPFDMLAGLILELARLAIGHALFILALIPTLIIHAIKIFFIKPQRPPEGPQGMQNNPKNVLDAKEAYQSSMIFPIQKNNINVPGILSATEEVVPLQNNQKLFMDCINNRPDLSNIDIPEEFLCGCSFDLMSEPATLNIYSETELNRWERQVLQKWCSDKKIDPITRENISELNIVTDKDLQKRINAWVNQLIEDCAAKNASRPPSI